MQRATRSPCILVYRRYILRQLRISTSSGHKTLSRASLAKVDENTAKFDREKEDYWLLINNTWNYWPERYGRVAKLHKLLDKEHGPLIVVRMNLLTRKTLGGIETDLKSNVMQPDGSHFPRFYAAGEAAGFRGGGVHG